MKLPPKRQESASFSAARKAVQDGEKYNFSLNVSRLKMQKFQAICKMRNKTVAGEIDRYIDSVLKKYEGQLTI